MPCRSVHDAQKAQDSWRVSTWCSTAVCQSSCSVMRTFLSAAPRRVRAGSDQYSCTTSGAGPTLIRSYSQNTEQLKDAVSGAISDYSARAQFGIQALRALRLLPSSMPGGTGLRSLHPQVIASFQSKLSTHQRGGSHAALRRVPW